MISGKKVTIVLPAYNAAKTLKQTYDEILRDIFADSAGNSVSASIERAA